MIRLIAATAALACLTSAPAFAQTRNAQCAQLYDQILTDSTEANVVIDTTEESRRPRVNADLMQQLNELSASLTALTDFAGTVNFGGDDWGRQPPASFGGEDWGRGQNITSQDDWESPLTALRGDLANVQQALRVGGRLTPAQRLELRRITTAIAAVDRGNCR